MYQVPSIYYTVCEWVVCNIAVNPGQVSSVFRDLVLFVYSVQHGHKFYWL